MTDRAARGETSRLIAWNHELRAVHARLREALELTRAAARDGAESASATRDLLLFCRGFCTALTGHHEGEDRTLFPALEQAHPELGDTLRKLEQDHSMIAYLLTALEHAVERSASPETIDRHLEGVAAVMENHFGYEERQLRTVLEGLDPAIDISLGPL